MLLQVQIYPVGGNNILTVDIGDSYSIGANKLKSDAHIKYHQEC